MPLSGGEARCVTNLPLGARYVTWIPQTNSLLVAGSVMRDHPSVDATADLIEENEGKALPVVTEDRIFRYWKKWLAGSHVDHLFRMDLADDSLTDPTPELNRLIGLDELEGAITVAPDGTTAIFSLDAGEPPWERISFSLHSVPLTGGNITRLPTGASAQQTRPRVSPDGSTLIYGARYEQDYYADHVKIVSHHLATGTEQDLTAAWDRSAGGWEFINDGCIVFNAVQRWSPMAHTHGIDIPTLVTHGELDYRVVITQGLVLYGTLKAKGVPVRLVYYPNEGHWIESRNNALHWWEEVLGWLDRWLG
jgi:dipeptidyl aminopeptidase/acylaminoacyl peptidase